MYNFGLGYLGLIPSGANPTPIPFAVLSDVSFDISYDMKELRGQYQATVDVARGALKATGKAKTASIMGSIVMAALGGATSANGSVTPVVAEAATIPTTPFQVTVANSATFAEDLGVLDLTTGKWMTRGATATGTGVYAVASGVYTFNTADTGHNLSIQYSYTTSAVGKTISLNNQLMGASTPYALRCYDVYGGKPFGFKFPAVHIPKLSFAMKAEAYTDVDIEFLIVQDTSSLKIMDVYVGE